MMGVHDRGAGRAGGKGVEAARYAMTTLPDLLHLMRGAGFGEFEVHASYASRGAERLDGRRMLVTARRMG